VTRINTTKGIVLFLAVASMALPAAAREGALCSSGRPCDTGEICDYDLEPNRPRYGRCTAEALSFGEAMHSPTGDTHWDKPYGGAMGDFNGDGVPDLVVSKLLTGDKVGVLLGAGDGSFGPATDFPVPEEPRFVAIGDLNQDGILDLVTAVKQFTLFEDGVAVLLGTGDGSFGDPTSFGVGENIVDGVAIADLDLDGMPDLAVAGGFFHDFTILRGSGDGSFSVEEHVGDGDESAQEIKVADVTLDGRPDIVIFASISRWTAYGWEFGVRISLYLGTETGVVQVQELSFWDTGGGESKNGDLAVGDLNGDGLPDVALTIDPLGVVWVFFGEGKTFGPPTEFPAGEHPRGLEIGDFDADGNPDLAIASPDFWDPRRMRTVATVSVLLGDGDGSFEEPVAFSVGPIPTNGWQTITLEIGDLNGDRKPDLVTVPYNTNEVSVLLNTTPDRDSDGDGIPNHKDNCPDVPNARQVNSNAGQDDDPGRSGIQAYGNVCDPDLDNDGDVDLGDYKLQYGCYQRPSPSRLCADADLVGTPDESDLRLRRPRRRGIVLGNDPDPSDVRVDEADLRWLQRWLQTPGSRPGSLPTV
jgi:hypothetical protein